MPVLTYRAIHHMVEMEGREIKELKKGFGRKITRFKVPKSLYDDKRDIQHCTFEWFECIIFEVK